MSILSHIRLVYSCHFSKTPSNHPVYQTIRHCHARKIVELGIGTGQRALKMIEVAKLASPQETSTMWAWIASRIARNRTVRA